jgi:hypothetical protein
MEGNRLRGALAAAALLLAAGCKVLPVDGNRAAGEPADESARYRPLGVAAGGAAGAASDEELGRDQVPVTDRWRVGFPAWDRGSASDSPYDHGAWWDPYHQHVLKGDYALPGTQNTFLVLEATGSALAEALGTPTPSGNFPAGGGGKDFFRNGRIQVFDERLNLSLDLFHGETSFKPVDWRFFVRGILDANQARSSENNALFADPGEGTDRDDSHAALQEAFVEGTLAAVSPDYDVVQARVGIQRFNADFRGFLLLDDVLGARLFGNLDDNRWQWNAFALGLRDKDTNSGLNEMEGKKANVLLLNVYRQDLLAGLAPAGAARNWTHGLTGQLLFARYSDEDSVSYNENGFLVRPRAVGTIRPNHRTVDYLGASLDGHVHRVNVSASLYRAEGTVSFDEIAGRRQDVSAHMAALELSVDQDWMRWKAFGFYQSGDDDPEDGDAGGFDAIHDVPNFAGGEFGFWNRNAVGLSGTGVGLVQRLSLLNSLRSSKDEGRPSYVNPGLLLAGAGWDGLVTPRLKVLVNASYLLFDDTSSLEYVLNQDSIDRPIGWDLSVGALWRPLLTENVIVKAGVACLLPGKGYEDIYDSKTPYSAFVELVLRW